MDPIALTSINSTRGRKPYSLFLAGLFLGAALVLGAWFYSTYHGLNAHLAGVWKGQAEIAGTEVELSLTLQKEGSSFSGLLVAIPGGEGTFNHLEVDREGDISFTMTVSNETVTFNGKVVSDAHTMAGKMTTTSYGNGTWSLAKQS